MLIIYSFSPLIHPRFAPRHSSPFLVLTPPPPNRSIAGNSKSLGTITGIINGSGSITAAAGLLVVGPLTRQYGWSSVWYFMMFLTVCGTGLMGPKILKELRGEDVDEDTAGLKGKNGEKGYQSDVKV